MTRENLLTTPPSEWPSGQYEVTVKHSMKEPRDGRPWIETMVEINHIKKPYAAPEPKE